MKCNNCLLEKSENEFKPSTKFKSGFLPTCNNCKIEKRKVSIKNYAQRHLELCKERNRVFQENGTINKKILINNLWKNAKVRASKQNVPFTITKEFIEELLLDLTCYYFGIPIIPNKGVFSHDTSPTLDRIIPEKGYIPENVVLCSYKANAIKGRSSLQELELLVKKLQKLYEDYDVHTDSL